MKAPEEVVIRSITPADHDAVARIARRSFSPTQSGTVRPGPDDLVATVGGRVAGAVLLGILDLPRQGRVGRIAWLFTDPGHRGRGLARRLVEHALDRLRILGCGPVVTEIEGYNSPSANIFLAHGFRRIGALAQQRWLGLPGALVLDVRTLRLVTPGHFLWVRGVAGHPSRPAVQRAGTGLLNLLVALLALSLGGGLLLPGRPSMPSASQTFALALAVVLLLGLREVAMRLAARTVGLRLEYRGWGAGAGASVLIAVLFGSVFPLPGNVYPPGDGWSYHRFRRPLALAAAAGTAAIAILLIVAAIGRARLSGDLAGELAASVVAVGMPLLLFDSVVAIGPFQGYNARRLRDYSRTLWLAFAATGISVLVLVTVLG